MRTHVHAQGGLQTPIDYFRDKDGQSRISCSVGGFALVKFLLM